MTAMYHFRPFARADLPMMVRWLQTAEVVRWWGEPNSQYALLEEDLDEPAMQQWIVEYDGLPFAYVQAYSPSRWPQDHFADLPSDAMAVDAFIGEPDMVGKGHGSAFLRQFARRLIEAGASTVVLDPSIDNRRARAAYARAGFIGDKIVHTPEGPSVLMVFRES